MAKSRPLAWVLHQQVQKGEHLEHHSRFAIATFLVGVGMRRTQLRPVPGQPRSARNDPLSGDHIRGDTSPTEYSTPACSTMQSYGDCVNMDDLCEAISHPMVYYEQK